MLCLVMAVVAFLKVAVAELVPMGLQQYGKASKKAVRNRIFLPLQQATYNNGHLGPLVVIVRFHHHSYVRLAILHAAIGASRMRKAARHRAYSVL
jgi:hypothetical protein